MSPSQPPPVHRSPTPLEQASDAAGFIRQRFASKPRVGLILGTGLGGLADSIADPTSIAYSDIPHFPRATVAGHAGRLVLGQLSGVVVAALQGRFHLYEGYTPAQIVLPTRTLRQLGIEILIVTNAAGGLAPGQQAGDLLLISEHIGLPTMAGQNPLVGPNDEQLGPRFPAMTDAYDVSLRAEACKVAQEHGFALHEGVYAMVSGPSFESPAELRFLRTIGADAVGMSTVPEVIAARHMGLRTLAISCITNVALPGGDAPVPEPSHSEVLLVAEKAGERLATVIRGVLEHISAVTGDGT